MNDIKRIYFIGIGGIGMSAIARYLLSIGKDIFGYDKTKTDLTKKLEGEGIKIHYEEDVKGLPKDIDLVIYTPAIPDTHAELVFFQKNGYDVIKRAEMLGRLSKVKKTIAIAGTHGKTSTSAMTAHLLKYGNKNISAFIGGIMSNYNSNYIAGDGDWMVVEADEYDRSFLHLEPDVIAIMSMDADHLDIYGDHESMQEGFEEFIKNIKPDGTLIVKPDMLYNMSGPTIDVLADKNVDVILFSLEDDTEVYATNTRVENGKFFFDLYDSKKSTKRIYLPMPGIHNMQNAMVAMTIGRILNLAPKTMVEGLELFKGIKRRFEKIVDKKKLVYIDDYAHHPTELELTIKSVRMLYKKRKITGVFQPHLYSRTRDFAEGFAQALDLLDEVILLDIYPAREEPIPDVTSEIIFEKLKNEKAKLIDKSSLLEELESRKFDVLLTLGAGDIDEFVKPIKNYLEKK